MILVCPPTNILRHGNFVILNLTVPGESVSSQWCMPGGDSAVPVRAFAVDAKAAAAVGAVAPAVPSSEVVSVVASDSTSSAALRAVTCSIPK